jgi:octaprenyl-diphosphate synthase
MTLPLIYALNQAERSEKRKIISIIKNNDNDTAQVNKVIAFVKAKGGIEYADQTMRRILNEALELLNRITGKDAEKEDMRKLVQFVIDRKH